jgi:hypothetical protein
MLFEALIWAIGAGCVIAVIGLWMQRHQANNPHGKCAYCDRTLAMFGPYARMCKGCMRTQPWAGGEPL